MDHGTHFAAESQLEQAMAFRVYQDWNGMYRWTLTSPGGNRLMHSQFSSPALAGAIREIEHLRNCDDRYAEALIYDESGR